MYNWRLLLFAFFAVFQPIASFAERNLVDGRHQCCDHRISRDSGNLNGNYQLKFPAEDRRLDYHREIREVRRDDIRNERTVLNRSPLHGFRDARERQLNRDFGSRVSRNTFMNNRVTPLEIRDIEARTTGINRDERNSVRDSLSRSRLIATTERRDMRNNEILSRYTQREINQRVVLQRMPEGNAEARRETRSAPRGTSEDYRRKYLERSAVSDFERRVAARNDVRDQRATTFRTTQSHNRVGRDITENRRSLSENRVSSERLRNTRSEIRGTRNEARDDVRTSDRIDRSSRSMERRSDYERLYRQPVVAVSRSDRINGEIRHFIRDDRRLEHRNMRESIRRLERVRADEIRRIYATSERNTERSTRAERRSNVSTVRNSRVENMGHIKAGIRVTIDGDRHESTRSEIRQNEERRERTHRDFANREVRNVNRRTSMENLKNMPNRRTLSFERIYEQRSLRAERQNYFESRSQTEREERRERNTRHLSLERESLIEATQRKERSTTMERRLKERTFSEANRFSSQNQDSRIMIRSNMPEKSRTINNIRNTERRVVDYRNKSTSELNKVNSNDWQYLMYAMQGIYLCTIFLPMLMEQATTKKKSSFKWGSTIQKLIKVD